MNGKLFIRRESECERCIPMWEHIGDLTDITFEPVRETTQEKEPVKVLQAYFRVIS